MMKRAVIKILSEMVQVHSGSVGSCFCFFSIQKEKVEST